jgi:single-strand DNA-binding protein
MGDEIMSDGMNKVLLLGNLGGDPELRYTPAGTAVLSFRIATNESWLDKNKERQERVEWHWIVVWGPRAEGLSRILAKGSGVLVEGGLRTSSYEKDGQKHYKTEVVAREVFLTGRRVSPPPLEVPVLADEGAPQPRQARANGFAAGKKPEPLEELPF